MIIVKWIVFLAVWMFGCAIADYVIEFDSRAYAMAWGVIVYFAAMFTSKLD